MVFLTSSTTFPQSSLESQGTYPLGRREAGGLPGHLRSEEGHDVLRRFAEDGMAWDGAGNPWKSAGHFYMKSYDVFYGNSWGYGYAIVPFGV